MMDNGKMDTGVDWVLMFGKMEKLIKGNGKMIK